VSTPSAAKAGGAGSLLPRSVGGVASATLGLAKHAVASVPTRVIAVVTSTVATVKRTVATVGDTVAAGLGQAVSTTAGDTFGTPPVSAPRPVERRPVPTPVSAHFAQPQHPLSPAPSSHVGTSPVTPPSGAGLPAGLPTVSSPFGGAGILPLATTTGRPTLATPTSMPASLTPPTLTIAPVSGHQVGSERRTSTQASATSSPTAMTIPAPTPGSGAGGLARSIGGPGAGGVLGLLLLVALASLTRGRGPRLGLLPLGHACHAFLSPLERPG
jgi:hypothetical protein